MLLLLFLLTGHLNNYQHRWCCQQMHVDWASCAFVSYSISAMFSLPLHLLQARRRCCIETVWNCQTPHRAAAPVRQFASFKRRPLCAHRRRRTLGGWTCQARQLPAAAPVRQFAPLKRPIPVHARPRPLLSAAAADIPDGPRASLRLHTGRHLRVAPYHGEQ